MFLIALMFAVAQSLTYVIYAAGYNFSAFLVAEGRNTHDEIFRSAVTATSAVVTILISCLIFPPPVTGSA